MLNHFVCMGRLTRDPELRYTAQRVPVATCRVAVNRPGSDKADFFDLTAWRHNGEFLAKHFVKGQQIAVEGRLQVKEWTGDGGQRRTSVEIVAENLYFAGGKTEKPEKSLDEAMDQASAFREIPGYEDDGELPY